MEGRAGATRRAMALIGLARLADRYRRVVVLAALLTTFAGVALLLDRPKGGGVAWVGLPLAALGSALFAWAAWPLRASSASRDTLASRAIRAITLQGRLLPF